MITIIQKYIQIQDICVLANVQTNLRQQPRGMKAGYILFNWVDVTRPADIIHYPQMKGKIFIIFSSRFLFLDYDRVTLHDSQFIIILYWFFLLMMSWFHPVHPLCDLTCLALEKPFPHWWLQCKQKNRREGSWGYRDDLSLISNRAKNQWIYCSVNPDLWFTCADLIFWNLGIHYITVYLWKKIWKITTDHL